MTARIEMSALPRPALTAMMSLERYLAKCSLDKSLIELVKLRVSQLNGCAYCIDMHTKELRAAGEDEQRLYLLSAWHEASCFSERERAALAWAEAVTQLGADRVSDDVYTRTKAVFSEPELADLTFVVVTINGWNRLNVALRTPAGSYRVGQFG